MKKFTFPLQRIRDFRGRLAEAEEVKLERLLGERAAGAAAIARLSEEQSALGRAPVAEAETQAQELAARDSYREHLGGKRKGLLALQLGCENRIAAQTRLVLEARRKVKLLDKLKERKLGDWTAEFDRELEALAAELFLAKMQREMANARRASEKPI